jgi:hypothetical protein
MLSVALLAFADIAVSGVTGADQVGVDDFSFGSGRDPEDERENDDHHQTHHRDADSQRDDPRSFR